MVYERRKDENKAFVSILMAHLILVLHVILCAGLILLVIFFRGMINYMIWVFVGGVLAVAASIYYFHNRIKKEGKTLREILASPRYDGRTVEVSVLGGVASLKISRPNKAPSLGSDSPGQLRQLEDPDTIRINELSDLVQLLEKNLITLDEYNKYKEKIFKL